MRRFFVTILILHAALGYLKAIQAVELNPSVGFRKIIENRCVGCHSTKDAEAGLDLESLLQSIEPDRSNSDLTDSQWIAWMKVQEAITQRRMPPEDEEPLTEVELTNFHKGYREQLILRNGMPHIGPTPLRRLTHSELVNALEDLLGITLRAEYNILSSVNIEPSFVEKILPVEVPGESGFLNDAYAQRQQPLPLLEYIQVIEAALSKVTRTDEGVRRAFEITSFPEQLTGDQIQAIAQTWLERAFRRPPTPEHLETAIEIYNQAVETSDVFQAIKTMAKWSLLQPEFIYRVEETRHHSEPYPVSDYELATRLSFFLNGSIPDRELLNLARDHQLSKPAVLEQQFTRLMHSPRRLSLSDQFAAQWLGFAQLIDHQQTGELGIPTSNRAQYDELLFFFDELFRANRPVMDIVDSNWVFISRYNGYDNSEFSKSGGSFDGYTDHLSDRTLTGAQRRGIENIYDPPTLQTVVGHRYGGVISTAGIMRITSAPERTSPVRRGVWLLDRLLGEKLEAPKNVPPLENAKRSLPKENPTKRELLAAHTDIESCQHCHKTIDPIGFGLENFDPAGKWRTQYPDQTEINSSGSLPGGKNFSSPQELKQQLLEAYREPIVRNFIEQLFAYALGRPLRPYDQITVDKIYETALQSEFRTSVILKEIVMSPQFLCRQDELQ